MRWIYISPHLDDAVLSAGGLIYEQVQSGASVEIWTIMCGVPRESELSPFARALHRQWGVTSAEETVRIRRAEDEKAAGILGAGTIHFDFLDCIYRRGSNGDWLYVDVFVPPHQDDLDLPRRIADAIAPRLTRDDNLICQLGLGSHVDHILVRRAVESLRRPLLYLADIPYLFNHPESLKANTAGMKENVHRVTEAGLRSWMEAVIAYASQLSSLFAGPEQMHESIRRYCEEWGGIPLWRAGGPFGINA
jgi:LmbE family N-acetylglucosaminyl deacetylase